jgi:hypothetical protein
MTETHRAEAKARGYDGEMVWGMREFHAGEQS